MYNKMVTITVTVHKEEVLTIQKENDYTINKTKSCRYATRDSVYLMSISHRKFP